MSFLEDERTELRDKSETGEIHDYWVCIATIEGRVSRLGIFLSRNSF